MASGQIFTDGNFQGVGTDGLIVANGKLYVYDNSTGLLATTYQDSALTITNTNPVILSASGKAKVFLNTGTYDITLKTSADAEVWTLNDYIADDVYTKSETDSILAARTVGTIADLRATTYSGQTIITVTGYYTAADNIGTRDYYWDSTSTETDNGGTIIQVTGVTTGRWKMKYSGAVNVKWFGAKGDGVTDDTATIISALSCVQSKCNSSFIYTSEYAELLFDQDGIYKISGNNVLGSQYANNIPIRYSIDFNGSRLLWTPTLSTDALFNKMANVYGLTIQNGTIEPLHTDLTPFGTFMKAGAVDVTTVFWANFRINNMTVSGQSARWLNIFEIDGTTLCSDTSVNDSVFYGFKYLFTSSNPEAINWNFTNCGAVTPVDDFRIFNINTTYWAGGITYIGGGIAGLSFGTFVYIRTSSQTTIGNLYLNTRTECRAQTTVVDTNGSTVVIENANLLGGGGPTTSINAKVDGNGVVSFKHCTVYTNTTVVARTVSDITTLFGSFRRGNITYDDCNMAIYRPSITYLNSAGATISHYDAVGSSLVTPMVVCSGNTYGAKGVFGIPYLSSYSYNIYYNQRYLDANIAGGGLGYGYLMSTGTGFVVEPNTIITSIKATVNQVAVGSYSLYGILLDTETTPTALLQFTNTGVKIHNFEVIPNSKEGIAYSSDTLPSVIKKIYFAAYDVPTSTWVKVGALQGHLEITTEPILYKQQRPSVENTIQLV